MCPALYYYAENDAELLKDELVDTGAEKKLCDLRVSGGNVRDCALKFPVLAGLQVCSPYNLCRQRLYAQARLKRAVVGAGVENVFLEAGFSESVLIPCYLTRRLPCRLLKKNWWMEFHSPEV
jgi:hypothetical protein